jgi:hypothetical protein
MRQAALGPQPGPLQQRFSRETAERRCHPRREGGQPHLWLEDDALPLLAFEDHIINVRQVIG